MEHQPVFFVMSLVALFTNAFTLIYIFRWGLCHSIGFSPIICPFSGKGLLCNFHKPSVSWVAWMNIYWLIKKQTALGSHHLPVSVLVQDEKCLFLFCKKIKRQKPLTAFHRGLTLPHGDDASPLKDTITGIKNWLGWLVRTESNWDPEICQGRKVPWIKVRA